MWLKPAKFLIQANGVCCKIGSSATSKTFRTKSFPHAADFNSKSWRGVEPPLFIDANSKTSFVVFLSLRHRGRGRTDRAPFDSIRRWKYFACAAYFDQHPARFLYPVDVSWVSSTTWNG